MNNLFVLNGATENRGCEAILLSTYDLIRTQYPAAKFINSSFRDTRAAEVPYLQVPGLAHCCHPAVATPAWLGWQFQKRLRGRAFHFERYLDWADNVISLGGDNYSEDYGSARHYYAANERILASGKRLIIWGASIGPFSSDQKLEEDMSAQLSRAHKIVVREEKSRTYLQTLGVVENVTHLPDPAFTLTASEVKTDPKISRALAAGAIGLNLSPLIARYRAQPERWLDDAVELTRGLLRKFEMPVVLIPHVMIPGNDDYQFHEQIVARIGSEANLYCLAAKSMSSRQLKHLIAQLRCFIGARTHATIASLSSAVPTISIGYSVKAAGINVDLFGDSRWLIEQKDLTVASLLGKTDEALLKESSIRQTLTSRLQSYRIKSGSIREVFG